MEIPNNIKNLYRHFDFHTKEPIALNPNLIFNEIELFENISWFVNERNNIWMKKILNEDPPYTDDIILSTYRFCNIFREFDKQTIEFHTLLNPLRDNFPLWLLNMFYCRMVARPETIREVGLLSFDALENKKLYERLNNLPRPRFGTPYVFPVSVILRSETSTREKFITEYLPSVMELISSEICKWDRKSVYDGVEIIIPNFKYNLKFLWTEVLIDVAYQFPQYINLFERFPIGPGSISTIKRINVKEDPTKTVANLSKISFNTGITVEGKMLQLSAENWEGIGCEYRKYCNLKAGNGRKRIFRLK